MSKNYSCRIVPKGLLLLLSALLLISAVSCTETVSVAVLTRENQPVPSEERTALQQQIKVSASLWVSTHETYPADAVKALTEAGRAADSVAANSDATAEELTEARKKLKEATADYKNAKVSDSTLEKLASAIVTAEAKLDEGGFDAGERDALTAAIADGYAVYSIDAPAADVRAAMTALEKLI